MGVHAETSFSGLPEAERLDYSTILAHWPSEAVVSAITCDLLIAYLEEHTEIPENEGPEVGDYEAAKNRFNRLREGINLKEVKEPQSIGEQFGSVKRALTAYFMEKKWEGGARAAGILGLSTFASANMVWIAQASGHLTDSFVNFIHAGANPEMLGNLATQGAVVAGLGLLSTTAYTISSRLERWINRDMSGWIMNKFNDTVLSEPELLMRMQHNQDQESSDPDKMPDALKQRVMQASNEIPGELMGVVDGVWSAVISSVFVAKALYDNSVPVHLLDDFAQKLNTHLPGGVIDLQPGEAGTFVAALVALASFTAINLPLARRFSEKLRSVAERKYKAYGNFFYRMWDVYEGAESIAATKTHNYNQRALSDLWDENEKIWRKNDARRAQFAIFKNTQNAMATGVAATPGLAGVLSGNLTFGGFTQNTILLGALMRNIAGIVNIIPDTANLMQVIQRLVDVAQIAEKAKNKKEFFQLSGHHEFEYYEVSDSDAPAIEIKNLRLLHRGEGADDESFVTINHMAISQNDRVYVNGASGCGKTSLFKAICGLWPYGEGSVAMRADQKLFYGQQAAFLPEGVSLFEQVLQGIPKKVDFHSAERGVISALKVSGLYEQLGFDQKNDDEIVKIVHGKTYKGKSWAAVLSGGQRQRLVLARIIYQQPDLILLDEPTSALDKQHSELLGLEDFSDGQSTFFRILGQNCPQATIVVIMHDEAVIDPQLGFFNKVIKFGRKGKAPIMIDIPAHKPDMEDRPVIGL